MERWGWRRWRGRRLGRKNVTTPRALHGRALRRNQLVIQHIRGGTLFARYEHAALIAGRWVLGPNGSLRFLELRKASLLPLRAHDRPAPKSQNALSELVLLSTHGPGAARLLERAPNHFQRRNSDPTFHRRSIAARRLANALGHIELFRMNRGESPRPHTATNLHVGSRVA
jgi:hypothetical protein